MKYEFHIGDYVETKDGVVGYIINVSIEDKGDVLLLDIQYPSGVGHNMITMDDLPYFFARIGQYDFTKPEVKKIEKLTYAESYINGYQVLTGRKLIDKINELVDIVNELRKESI